VSEDALEEYLRPVWTGEQGLIADSREKEARQRVQIAEGYEQIVQLGSEMDGRPTTWTERHLIVLSQALS
jgi:hypothetical protein